jgi:hypothetical protein
MATTRFVCLIILCAAGLGAGDEFPVNVRTAGNQCNPAAVVAPHGGFILVWSSYYSSSGRSNEILARRFDPNGHSAGDEFQVNATSEGNQTEPAIAIAPDGRLLVVWQGPGADGEEDIFARLLDPNGTPIAEDRCLTAGLAGRQIYPGVAACLDGTFIVVWEHQPAEGSDDPTTVRGQRCGADGIPLGSDFGIDDTAYDSSYPDIATDGAGHCIVTWIQNRSNKTVRARRFDPNGLPIAEPFDVSVANIASLTRPSVAMSATGDFVIAWDGDPQRASRDDIHARCFDPNGTPRSEPFVVNTLTDGAQQWPQVATNGTNAFVIVWQHKHDNADLATDIYARSFDAQAAPLGPEVKLNSYVAGKQRYPEVTMTADGAFLAMWESDDQDGSGYGVFACKTAPARIADLNADNSVDFGDFRLLATSWLALDELGLADLTGDAWTDARDLKELCRSWLE